MTFRAVSVLCVALAVPCLSLGLTASAQGGEGGEDAGYACMPADTAKAMVKAQPLPDWYWHAEEEQDLLQEFIDDCMENGYLRFDGDVGHWVDNPTLAECEEEAVHWMDDRMISAECRAMGKTKYLECMANADDTDWYEWVMHEIACDRIGEGCAYACVAEKPDLGC